MTKITKKYLISAPIEKVWEALIDPKIIKKWGAGPAKMSPEKGFEFKLWGGDVFGTNTKVVENKLLEQDWYAGKWEKPSKVVIKLSEKSGKTLVNLTQTEMPKEEIKDLDEGWDDYYFGEIKKFLES